jgi:hypothetical protein
MPRQEEEDENAGVQGSPNSLLPRFAPGQTRHPLRYRQHYFKGAERNYQPTCRRTRINNRWGEQPLLFSGNCMTYVAGGASNTLRNYALHIIPKSYFFVAFGSITQIVL